MNYLAHFLLSHETPEAIRGAILGDFVKGRVDRGYPPEIARAIQLHRAIDRFTDDHPIVRRSRALVSPPRRRFAPILIDLFYDHFLARHWQRFTSAPLMDFSRNVYRVLWEGRARYPLKLQSLLPRMISEDWLGSYREPAVIARALKGIATRFRLAHRAAPLVGGERELADNYQALNRQFLEFFPELLSACEAGRVQTAAKSGETAKQASCDRLVFNGWIFPAVER